MSSRANAWRTRSLELECADLFASLDILEEEKSLTEVAVFGRLLHLVTPNPDLAARQVRESLGSTGIPIARLEAVSPSLEDVFVTLTLKEQSG